MRNAILVVLLASAGYIIPAYFLQRDDIGLQLLFFGIEFALYLWCIKKLQISTVAAIALCVVPRLVWIASEPQMSDDYYRFYWDGQLVSNGMDPYAETPTQLQKQEIEGLPNVFTQLNSPNYYSSYPPFHQFLFFVAASCGSLKSFIITTRILLILADVLILFLIARLAANKKLTFNPVWAYGLNPLVITELTGNLHFEGVCMALWLLAVWWMFSNKNVLSVITWGLACCTKLIPVYLVAALWPARSFGRALITGMASIALLTISFIFFTGVDGIQHFSKSVGLYFNTFEFNASFYFLAREIGTAIKGYNPIFVIGPAMGILFILTSIFICWKMYKNKITDIFLISAIVVFAYYILSTTVHPWYTINLLIPGILAGLHFPIAWTGLVFLSYIFYSTPNAEVYYGVVLLEYITLFTLVFYEIKSRKKILFHG